MASQSFFVFESNGHHAGAIEIVGTGGIGNWWHRELASSGTGIFGNWHLRELASSGTGIFGNWYLRELVAPGTGDIEYYLTDYRQYDKYDRPSTPSAQCSS